MNLVPEINALKKAETAVPESTRRRIPPALYDLEIMYVIDTEMIPKMNADN